MRENPKRNFILQQGLREPVQPTCGRQYSALIFQGRVVLVWVVAGILLRISPIFFALAAALWWSALLPKLNPFDAVHNALFCGRAGAFHLTPAPAPRRFAQMMAGTFALACGLLLYSGHSTAAYVLEGIFLAAVLALTLGGFCAGSFVYHLLRGNVAFALQTLPWANNP